MRVAHCIAFTSDFAHCRQETWDARHLQATLRAETSMSLRKSFLANTLLSIVLLSASRVLSQDSLLAHPAASADLNQFVVKAELGDPSAQFQLGFRLMQGLGVAVDFPEAAKWYNLAAAQGSAEANFGL